ncbi:MAG: 23S rRNA (uracil(1939)-C(5))-methyltransferase RlmD [Bacteroidales bacterium]
MSRRKKNQILTNILIEDVAAEGKAIGHVDGKVIFVPQVIPGDVCDVLVTRKKSGYIEGRYVKLVKKSPDRLEPFCEHYGLCGGCTWQPLPYELQLKYKQKQVKDQLTRIGNLELPEIQPIIGSEKTTEYRNKLEFTFSDRRWIIANEDAEKIFSSPIPLNPANFPNGQFPRHLRNGFSSVNTNSEGYALGFHLGGFFDKVLDIKNCYLQSEPSNLIRNFIKLYAINHNIQFFNLREQEGCLRNVIIRNNLKGDVMLTLSVKIPGIDKFSEPKTLGDPNEILNNNTLILENKISCLLNKLIEEFPAIKSLNYVINNKGNDSIADLNVINYSGEDAIYEEMEGISFKIGPKSFYQTNSAQAYKLYSLVREFADLKGDERIFDLYTGTGTIALFLASQAKEIYGIEYIQEAINDAKVNAKNNHITNCEFFAGDMKDVLNDDFIQKHGGTPNVIILDPPRAGIYPDVLEVILNAEAEKIVYVSCNPATQARDLSKLSKKYEITAVRPVDMFPHTHHVENVCALRIKK